MSSKIIILQGLIAALFFGLAGCERSETTQAENEATPDAELLSITEIAEGIFVHTGRHAPFDSPHADDIANIGFIIGKQCVAVIDTGGSISIGRKLRQTIQSKTDTPICYVINTHVHYDHLLGDQAFRQDNVEFIGHVNLANAVAASRPFFLEEYTDYLGGREDAVIEPDRNIEDTLTLDLGDRQLDITAWPTAHTNTDLTIFDTQTQTLWAGDLLFMERMPALEGSLKGWLEVMQQLEQIPAERVVPGHGPESAAWPEALAAQRNYLNTLLEETRAVIRSGQFLDEALESVGQAEKQHWQLADQHHKRNISHAYSELEWE